MYPTETTFRSFAFCSLRSLYWNEQSSFAPLLAPLVLCELCSLRVTGFARYIWASPTVLYVHCAHPWIINIRFAHCILTKKNRTYSGTKHTVNNFVTQVLSSLHKINTSPQMTPSEKLLFYKQVSVLYGRTALCLSGGATLTYFHIGVMKALYEQGVLPNIITGTSAGAMVHFLYIPKLTLM